MIRILGMFALLAGLCAGAAFGQEIENPYANAKVGDWVKYKMTSTTAAGKDITMLRTVTAKDAENVSFKSETLLDGNVVQTEEEKVSLKDKFDPTAKMRKQGGTVKLEKEDKETIEVKGKKVECRTFNYSIDLKEKGVAGTTKAWFHKDIPMGLCKADTDLGKMKVTMELLDYGSK